jgi:hypothetical protein
VCFVCYPDELFIFKWERVDGVDVSDCPIEVFLLNGSVTLQVNIYGDGLWLEQ